MPASLNVIGTMAGGGIQTGAGGARAVFDQYGLHQYGGDGLLHIFLDPTNARISTYDTDGVTVRAQMGNLPLNGVSQAQWGFRANDATGAPVFDSLGLIAVMKQPAGSPSSIGNQNTSSTSAVAVTGSTVSFFSARQQTILVMCAYQASYIGGAGSYAYVQLQVDNGGTGPQGIHPVGQNYTNATVMASSVVAAGAHTARLVMNVDNGASTLYMNAGQIFVFLLGS